MKCSVAALVAASLFVNCGVAPALAAAEETGAISAPKRAPALQLAQDPGAGPAAAPDKAAQENIFWQSVQQSNTVADYKAYLDAFPNGLYAPLARNRIAALSAAPAALPAPAAQAPAPVAPAPLINPVNAAPPARGDMGQPPPGMAPPGAMTPPGVMTPPGAMAPPPAISPEALKAEIGTVETEQALGFGPPARMEAQQRLTALGLYNGPIDGDLGPGARAGIAEWQRRHALAPTGELGPLQWAALRAESEPAYEQLMASRPPAPPPVVYAAPRPVYHPVARPAAQPNAAPAVLGVLGGLAIGLLGSKLGGKGGGFGGIGGGKGGKEGGKGGGKKHR